MSEIIRRDNVQERVACIEKWAAIADICRCMHNYNGVLQICAAFVNSSVYRLKKTWEKLTKQVNKVKDFFSYLSIATEINTSAKVSICYPTIYYHNINLYNKYKQFDSTKN